MDSQKKNRFSGLKKAISVTVMGTVCLTAAVSVAALSKTVTITDGDKTMTISTMNPDTNAILEKTGVELGKNDKLVRTDDDGQNVNISILRAFSVDVVDEGKTKTLTFNDGTVADALKAAGMTLSKNDTVSFSANTELEPDMEIKIARWYTVNLDVRGEKFTKDVPTGTVAEALEFLNIKLGENDILCVDSDKKVTEGMDITIQTVTYKNVTSKKNIAYKSETKETSQLYLGETQIEREGQNGERTIVTRQKYINGELDSEKEISNKVTKKAVNEIILSGTAEKINHIQTNAGQVSVNETENLLTDTNGNTVSYSRVLTGSGTAYTAPAGALTSTGRVAQYGVVAVDPNLIPYGSNLYIVSNDGQIVYGYAVAGDTGGAMMAGEAICDLYYPTYDECTIFGRRDITIYVLN